MKQLFLLAGLFYCCRLFAQDYTRIPCGFRSVNNGIGTEITCYGAATVRVLKYPVGDSVRRQSLSVIRQPGGPEPDIRANGTHIVLKTTDILADFDAANNMIRFIDPHTGAVLLEEKPGGTQFTAVEDAGSPAFIVRQAFQLDTAEAIYGLGQQQNGWLNQRFQHNLLVQGNTK